MRHGLCLAISLLACGCASTTYTLTGVPIGKQAVSMDRGTATVQSAWQGSTVTVQPASGDLHGEIGLFITLENTSDAAGDFGTENIAISNDGQTWTPVKTYEQLKEKLDSQTAWQKFGAALISSLDMAAASQAGRYNEHGYIATPYGGASFSFTGVNRGEQAAAINAAAGRTNDRMQSIDENHAMNVAQLDMLALRTTTVAPGARFGGLVVADAPKLNNDNATPVLVRVSFLGDTHIVEFQAHTPGGYTQAPVLGTATAAELTTEADRNIAPSAPPTRDAEVAQGSQSEVAAGSTPVESVPAFQRYDAWQRQNGQKPNSDPDE